MKCNIVFGLKRYVEVSVLFLFLKVVLGYMYFNYLQMLFCILILLLIFEMGKLYFLCYMSSLFLLDVYYKIMSYDKIIFNYSIICFVSFWVFCLVYFFWVYFMVGSIGCN